MLALLRDLLHLTFETEKIGARLGTLRLRKEVISEEG
jgi:hypothetical protein